jgi:hypothetical protein
VGMPTFLTTGWDDIEKFFGLNGKTTADTTGMDAGQAKAATAGATLRNAGLLVSVLGGVNQAIGSYFAAKTAQYQMKSQASSYQYQSDMAAINARAAEYDAQSILESGKSQVAQYTMEAGQQKAAAKTSMAARGITLGEGSSRDVEASMDIVKGLDVLNINSNSMRAAEAERTQAQNYRNASMLDSTSAQNAYASARSISPMAGVSTSLLNSATSIASQWSWQRKIDQMSQGGYN